MKILTVSSASRRLASSPVGSLDVLLIFVVAAFGLLVPNGAAAQATPHRALLALSKHEHTLAIVDPETLKVIARAPVGPDPHEVIASSDGRTAYVSIYGFGR